MKLAVTLITRLAHHSNLSRPNYLRANETILHRMSCPT
jgi:hypothetical protein